MFFVTTETSKDETLEIMNKATFDWTMRCARGEEYWVCADCGVGCPDGMPDQCVYNDSHCTDIIIRDKKEALEENKR